MQQKLLKNQPLKTMIRYLLEQSMLVFGKSSTTKFKTSIYLVIRFLRYLCRFFSSTEVNYWYFHYLQHVQFCFSVWSSFFSVGYTENIIKMLLLLFIILIKPVEKYEERLKVTDHKKTGHLLPESRLNTSSIFEVTLH